MSPRRARADASMTPPHESDGRLGNRMVITQYRILDEQRTTIVCAKHERELLAKLREARIGSGSTFAPPLMSCDRCESAKSPSRAD